MCDIEVKRRALNKKSKKQTDFEVALISSERYIEDVEGTLSFI